LTRSLTVEPADQPPEALSLVSNVGTGRLRECDGVRAEDCSTTSWLIILGGASSRCIEENTRGPGKGKEEKKG